eukprot:TRINITY_DN50596_c0_g2_i1.p1 TRINITY_DN50596_c0_g2~~TRINITY_DN50596_c0_g2_i1.p1  ORF type:complete len:316 (-),score=47.02 TRINITY_DN50596_c0_g2_i1:186-1133(-)
MRLTKLLVKFDPPGLGLEITYDDGTIEVRHKSLPARERIQSGNPFELQLLAQDLILSEPELLAKKRKLLLQQLGRLYEMETPKDIVVPRAPSPSPMCRPSRPRPKRGASVAAASAARPVTAPAPSGAAGGFGHVAVDHGFEPPSSSEVVTPSSPRLGGIAYTHRPSVGGILRRHVYRESSKAGHTGADVQASGSVASAEEPAAAPPSSRRTAKAEVHDNASGLKPPPTPSTVTSTAAPTPMPSTAASTPMPCTPLSSTSTPDIPLMHLPSMGGTMSPSRFSRSNPRHKHLMRPTTGGPVLRPHTPGEGGSSEGES